MTWRGLVARSHRAHRWGLDCRCVSAFYGFSEIHGIQVIVHGPRGCAYHLNTLPVDALRQQLLGFEKNPIAFSTNVGEESAIYGSSEHKLRQALKDLAAKTRPAAIGLVNTCIPAIVGDDVDTIAREVEDETGIPIIVACCEAFEDDRGRVNEYLEAMRRKIRGEEVETGIERCGRLTALRAVLEKSLESANEASVDEYSVGFETYGRLHYYEDIRGEAEEVAEVLGRAGIRLNIFPGCRYSDVPRMLGSSVFFSRRLRSVFRRIAGRTGARVLTDASHHKYSGVKGIERFYMDVGRVLSREGEVEDALKKKVSWFLENAGGYRSVLEGRRLGLVATPTSLVNETIELASMFGLKVPLVIIKTEWHRRYGADERVLDRFVEELVNKISHEHNCEVLVDPDWRREIDKLRGMDLVCVMLFSNSIENALVYRREGIRAYAPSVHGFSIYRLSYRNLLRFGEAALKTLEHPVSMKPLYARFKFSEKLFPFLEDEVPYRLCFEEVLRRAWNKPFGS